MALSWVLPLTYAAPSLRTCITPALSSSSGASSGESCATRNAQASSRRGGPVAYSGLDKQQQQRQPWQNGRGKLQIRNLSTRHVNFRQRLTRFPREDSSWKSFSCAEGDFSARGEVLKICSWSVDCVGGKGFGSPYKRDVATHASSVTAVEEAVGSSQEVVQGAVDSEPTKPEPKLAGGEGGDGRDGGDRGGGGGGGGDGTGDEGKDPTRKLSASQILTLLYAALVGVGGIVGFAKSGSAKSLFSGGGAALLLFAVFTQLPVRPHFASSVGLGISAVLLAVMFPRFKKSGKFLPAGLVALVSFIMTGGYVHGIFRTAH